MSFSQIQQYEKILAKRAYKIEELDKQLVSNKERTSKLKLFGREFKAEAQKILSPEQFERWSTVGRPGKDDRRYIENLGMTPKQIQEFFVLRAAYKAKRKSVFQTVGLSDMEKDRLVKEHTADFRNQLAVVINREVADFLVRNYLIEVAVKNAQQNHPFMTLYQARLYSASRLAADEKIEALKKQGLSIKEQRKRRAIIEKERLADVEKILSPDQFAKWSAQREALVEKRFMEKYGLSKEQLDTYKKLLNQHAVNNYTTSKSRSAEAIKKLQWRGNRQKLDKEVEMLLPPDQYALWKKNNNRAKGLR